MKMDTWIRCNIHMYEHFGGVPTRTVCDNLKTGVIKHPKDGEIILTDSYEAMGNHYITAIMPASIKKPKHYQKKSVIGNLCKKSSYLKTYGYIFADKVFLRLLN
jgi:hypothetical protein